MYGLCAKGPLPPLPSLLDLVSFVKSNLGLFLQWVTGFQFLGGGGGLGFCFCFCFFFLLLLGTRFCHVTQACLDMAIVLPQGLNAGVTSPCHLSWLLTDNFINPCPPFWLELCVPSVPPQTAVSNGSSYKKSHFHVSCKPEKRVKSSLQGSGAWWVQLSCRCP